MNYSFLTRSRNILSCFRRNLIKPGGFPIDEHKDASVLKEFFTKEDIDKVNLDNDTKKPYLLEIDFSNIPIEQQAVIFCPGQGAQTVGMLEKTKKENPKALKLFDEASEILGYDLQKIIDEGPSSKLNQTIYTQPAILVSSLVAYENLKLLRPNIEETLTHIAGFSVGEYTAAVISGILPFSKAVELVKARAEAMHKCCQYTPSKMVTVSIRATSRLEELAKDSMNFAESIKGVPLCELSCVLFRGHKVIGMSDDCYKYFSEHATDYDVQIIKLLAVEGAFHTRLMSEAAKELSKLIIDLKVELPICNFYSNFTGKIVLRREKEIKDCLINQICNHVKWEQIQQMIFRKHQKKDGKSLFPMYFEVGPGKSLGAMWCKTSKNAYKNYMHISC